MTVVLLRRQIAFLDRLSADVRATSGLVVTRAEVIRALVDALESSGVDLRHVASGAELEKRIRSLCGRADRRSRQP